MEDKIVIETEKELRFDRVAYYRKKMKQSDIAVELNVFIQMIEQCGAKKNGPLISTTYGSEMLNDHQLLDMEFLMPIQGGVLDLDKIKPTFLLTNALYSRFQGRIEKMDTVLNKMMQYIQINGLSQITSIYTLNVNDDPKDPILDIYIGLNPNRL